MERQRLTVDAEFVDLGPGPRQVLALFGATDASVASTLLLRYGATARRAFASAFRILRDLQGDRFNRTPNTVPAPPRPAPSPESSSEQQPVPSAPAAFVANNPARTRLTLVRRYPDVRQNDVPVDAIQHEFQPEILKLPNEPKTAAATANAA
jgi:hypothetical protein